MSRIAAARAGSEVGLGMATTRTVVRKEKYPRAGCWCTRVARFEVSEPTHPEKKRRRHMVAVPSTVYTCLRCATPQTLDDHVIDSAGVVDRLVVCVGCGQETALRLEKWKTPIEVD